MGTEIALDVTLTSIDCGECGGTYAINERYRKQKWEQGGFWNCPYCQTSWGFGQSENARLKKELANAIKRKEWAEQDAKHAEDCRRAEKAAKTRLKNRIHNGVCPCCNRTFQNLQKHMKKQHPDYVKSE